MMTPNQKNPNLLHLQNAGSIFFERVFSFQWRGRRERFRWYRKSGLPFISVVSTDQNCQMFGGGGPCPSYATNYGTLNSVFFTVNHLIVLFTARKQDTRCHTFRQMFLHSFL